MDVIAVAMILHWDGPSTTQRLMRELGQTQRDVIDRATALGCQLGLFTRSTGARNQQTFALVPAPEREAVLITQRIGNA